MHCLVYKSYIDMALLNENGGKLKAALVDMPMRGSIQGRTAFAESATTLSVHFSHMFNIRQEPADADRFYQCAFVVE